MRKLRQKKDRSIKTPILGFGVLLASTLVFLLILCIVIIAVRVVMG